MGKATLLILKKLADLMPGDKITYEEKDGSLREGYVARNGPTWGVTPIDPKSGGVEGSKKRDPTTQVWEEIPLDLE